MLPAYAHDDLEATFPPLMEELRRSLSARSGTARPAHPAARSRTGRRRGARSPDLELLRSAGFVLAVGADVPSDTVRARFPSQVKIGPVEKIRDLRSTCNCRA